MCNTISCNKHNNSKDIMCTDSSTQMKDSISLAPELQ